MAGFKTAYLQREMVLDVKVAKNLKVGDLIKVSEMEDDGVTPKTVTASTAADADYIIAQSDMTMNRRDYTVSEYSYSDKVAQSENKKKIAVFPVYESDDIVVTSNETVAD